MKFTVIITEHAERDVQEAMSYIVAIAPLEGRKWLAKVNRRMTSLARFPHRCTPAPEAKPGEELRQFIVGLFRILYLVHGSDVYVLSVQRSAQLPLTRGELKRRLVDRAAGQRRV